MLPFEFKLHNLAVLQPMKKDNSAQDSTANLIKAKEEVQILKAQYQQYEEYLKKYLIFLH